MSKPTPQRRVYPWERPASNRPAPVAEPIRPPAIIAQVPRVAVSSREAAASLNISVATLETLRRSGEGPPSLILPGGRRRLYPLAGLVRWATDRAAAEAAAETADDYEEGPRDKEGIVVTLPEIISIEPRVGELLADAAATGERCDWRTYERFKARMRRLVGVNAEVSALVSVDAYEVVFRALCNALEI